MPSLHSRAAPNPGPGLAAAALLARRALSRRFLLQGSAAAVALLAAQQTLATPQPPLPLLRPPLRQPANAVTLGMRGEPRSLDPAFAYDFVANPVVCQITEGLLRLTHFGELDRALAASGSLSEDGRTYTYTLRDNVTFHDGSPLTPADVVASFNRLRDPALGSPLSWMFDRVTAIAASGEQNVTIALASPWPLFPYVLATTAGHVLPAAFLAAGGEAIDRAPIGTGPFQFETWTAGERIVLAAFPDYREGAPSLAQATFDFVDDDPRQRERFLQGELNGLVPDALTPTDYAALAGQRVLEIPGHTALFVAFRCDQAPFDDPRVRRAVAQAVDIDRIFGEAIGATGICAANALAPLNVYLPCSNAGLFDPMPFQPDAARETIGRLRPEGFPAVLNVLDEDPWRATGKMIADAINAELGGLGVHVVTRLVPYPEFIAMERNGDYEGMLLATWAADFPDVSASLRPLFHSGGPPAGRNLFRYENLAVDERIDRAQGDVVDTPENPHATAESLDAAARCALLLEAQQDIAADQPYILIGHFNWFMPLASGYTAPTLGPFWFWDDFLRDIQLDNVDNVFAAAVGEAPAIDVAATDCQNLLQGHLDYMREADNHILPLSIISLDALGAARVANGVFTCQQAEPEDETASQVVSSGAGHWFRDPRAETDWRGTPIGLELVRGAAPARALTLQLVPPADLGPPIPLRPLRCDTGTLVAVAPWPAAAQDEAAVYLISLDEMLTGAPPSDEDEDEDGDGDADDVGYIPQHQPGPAPCSSEATFLLARAFRWAREVDQARGVEVTVVSNAAGIVPDQHTRDTYPGFQSQMTILSAFLTYELNSQNTILGMPESAILRGSARRLESNEEQAPPSPPGTPTPALAIDTAATPGPVLPGGVCVTGEAAPPNLSRGRPFAAGAVDGVTIIEDIRLSGPTYRVSLLPPGADESNAFHLEGLRVEAGVLIGMPASNDPDGSPLQGAPIEYALSFRLADLPPATPVPPDPPPPPDPPDEPDID